MDGKKKKKKSPVSVLRHALSVGDGASHSERLSKLELLKLGDC